MGNVGERAAIAPLRAKMSENGGWAGGRAGVITIPRSTVNATIG
jgi:hypothetical protein